MRRVEARNIGVERLDPMHEPGAYEVIEGSINSLRMHEAPLAQAIEHRVGPQRLPSRLPQAGEDCVLVPGQRAPRYFGHYHHCYVIS